MKPANRAGFLFSVFKNVYKRHHGNNNDLSPVEYEKRYFEKLKSL